MPRLENNGVTVTTTATRLCEELPNRTWVNLTNDGSVTVYVGNESVSTTSYALKLLAGEERQFTEADDLLPQVALYGRVASGTALVSVGETRL